jgi:hypothetical protein
MYERQSPRWFGEEYPLVRHNIWSGAVARPRRKYCSHAQLFATQYYLVDFRALLKTANVLARDILLKGVLFAVLLFKQKTDADREAGRFDEAAFFLGGIDIGIFVVVVGNTMATNRLGLDVVVFGG